MNRLASVLRREPVLLGGAATATLAVLGLSEAALAAGTAWIAWAVRMLCVPVAAVQKRVDEAAREREEQIHAYLEGATRKTPVKARGNG